jgi:hypothetical protein
VIPRKNLAWDHYKWQWTVIKRVFEYLCGKKYYDICYQGKSEANREVNVHGFVDVNWARDMDRRRLTSGYVFKMFG